MKKIFKYFIVLSIVLCATNYTNAQISVGISIRTAPPALPIYTQRYCPGDGYMWTPGYWAYNDEDYYWVPDSWLLPPQFGFLWTPGYWGFADGFYGWNQGYWGRHIGYYGGINIMDVVMAAEIMAEECGRATFFDIIPLSTI